MSVILITHPFGGMDVCATCLELQMHNFRNSIKEQWNRYNNDGKFGRVEIPFKLNPVLLWEEPITIINNQNICLTHYFTRLNLGIEKAMGESGKPTLAIAQGDLSQFMKNSN
jgi:hypothetical protein